MASISYTNSILSASTLIHGQCTLGCDNIGALQASFGWNNPTPDWACYDILSLIRDAIKESPIKWKPLHIKGHQDDKVKFGELSIAAQANVIADHEAKREMNTSTNPTETYSTTGNPWPLQCNGKRIRGQVDKRLREEMQVHQT